MRARGIFLLFILSSTLLLLVYLYLFAKPLHLEHLERERIANIQKVCMKSYPRRKNSYVLQRTIMEAEEKVQRLLGKNPIQFDATSIHIKDKVTLKVLIDTINSINESVILTIATHTDQNGSSLTNLKLSQERADMLKEYIRDRSQILLITSIGYGEELPLPKTTKKTTDRRVEIHLRRIKK